MGSYEIHCKSLSDAINRLEELKYSIDELGLMEISLVRMELKYAATNARVESLGTGYES
jgi:hypothetical protein